MWGLSLLACANTPNSYVDIFDNRLHDMVGSASPTEPVINTGAMYLFDHDHIAV